MQTQTTTPSRVPGRLDMTRVDEKKVDHYLAHYGQKLGGKLETKAQRLLEHSYVLEKQGVRQATCDDCNGQSDVDLPECPFCGATGVEDTAAAAPAPAVTRAADPDSQVVPKVATKSKAQPRSSANGHAGEKAKPAAKPKAEKPKPQKAKAGPTQVVPPRAGNQALAAAPAHPDAIKKVDAKKVAKLNEACKRIRGMSEQAAKDMYQLGKELAAIEAGELWRHRMAPQPNGTFVPLHSSFNRFVQDELGISTTLAAQLIAVSQQFTLAEVNRPGMLSKLRVVVSLPPEKRAAALAEAEAGASKHEIARRHQTPRNTPDGRQVTAVLVLGQVELTALKIPADGKLPTPAARIQDEPWCVLEFENGVTQRIQLKKSADGHGLKFVVTTQRGAAKPAVVDAPVEDDEAGDAEEATE